jgi:uncharacterized membrane protein
LKKKEEHHHAYVSELTAALEAVHCLPHVIDPVFLTASQEREQRKEALTQSEVYKLSWQETEQEYNNLLAALDQVTNDLGPNMTKEQHFN